MNASLAISIRRALVITLGLVAFHSAQGQSVRFDGSGNLMQVGPGAVASAPTLRGPGSRVVAPGRGTALGVSWTGTGVRFQWYFNGAPLAGETRDTLLLTSVSASQAGGYTVVAQNTFGAVTSQVARVELDSDWDGLGDAWELAQFASLTNQNAMMDADADGTSNLLEYQDNTSATNKNSLLARLEIATVGGEVVRTPDVPVYSLNDVVSLAAVPEPGFIFISWSGALTGSTNPASVQLTGNQTIQATFGRPLNLALNTTNRVTTGGSGGWRGQNDVSRDGLAAAVAPPLVQSGNPYLAVEVIMKKEGTATFDWRVDGEEYSTLGVYVNGRQDFWKSQTIQGSGPWLTKTVYLPAGTNVVRWEYSRSGGGWTETEDGLKPRDTAYVDRLQVQEYSNPLTDTDGNGLPDLWEYRFFDQLGNPPTDDPDADGVPTIMELADGTDPGRRSSVKPRVTYVVEGQGTAVASPGGEFYTYGQTVTNTAVPAQGWSFVGWIGPFDNDYLLPKLKTNNPAVDRVYQAKTYRAIFGLPLGNSVDAPELAWTTSPQRPWYGQARVTQDGVDAAQSALTIETAEQSESWLQTVVTGPGTLSFLWKTDTADRDYVTLQVNGAEATTPVSGKRNWQAEVLALPAGQQTLRWMFSRNYGYDTNALNTVWLDQVRFTAGTSKPEFVQLPASLAGFEGKDLSLTVAARGTPSMTYQVLRNGTAITQPATNQTIVVPAVTPALAGNWVIRAQNQVGATDSTPIPVTVTPLPVNDAFASATALSGLTGNTTGYSIGATGESSEPSHDGYSPRASVWYRYTAPTTGAVRFTATATNPPANLILAAYRGSRLSALTELSAGNAYAQETGGTPVAKVSIQFPVTAGLNYSLAVDAGEEGAYFGLAWEPTPPPVNDAFAARLPLTGSVVEVDGDNTLATLEPNEPALISMPPFLELYASNSLWWSWTAPATGALQIQPGSSGSSVLVSVFTGNTLTSLNRLTDPFGGSTSVPVLQGTNYTISAGVYGDSPGPFSFLLSMNALSLSLIAPPGETEGFVEVMGAPHKPVTVQFSPNLRDWYFWSSNSIGSNGKLRVSLTPPVYTEGDETLSIPPAAKRFFRAVTSP